jgi:hypothetical protein
MAILGTTELEIRFRGRARTGDRAFDPELGSKTYFVDGTGAGAAQKVGKAVVTLIAGAPQNIALTSSSTFKDESGLAITFTKIKGLAFETPSGNAAAMVIGAAASNAWATLLGATGTLTLPPGTELGAKTANANGWAVTAGDVLKVDGDGTDSVTIWVLGEGTAA